MEIMYYILIRGRNCEAFIDRCVSSLYSQTLNNWRAMIVLDQPKDGSVKKAMAYKGIKIYVHENETRKGLCQNMWFGVNLIKEQFYPRPEDVICILDADDYLDPKALNIINKHYERKGCLATYGSYIKLSKGRKTKISAPYPNGVKVRASKWHGSHFKTFKFKLWEIVPQSYFQHDGKWGEAASDLALMFSILELAGLARSNHISKPIYYWRDDTKFKTKPEDQKHWEKIFRNKKPLEQIA